MEAAAAAIEAPVPESAPPPEAPEGKDTEKTITIHKPSAQGPGTAFLGRERLPVERREIDHKEVDLNDVFDEVYTYMNALEKRIRENPDGDQAKIDGYKKEAALDIIALVQKRFAD